MATKKAVKKVVFPKKLYVTITDGHWFDAEQDVSGHQGEKTGTPIGIYVLESIAKLSVSTELK